MQDIHRLLKAAARRLLIGRFLASLVVMATAVSGVLFAMVLAEKLTPWSFPWTEVFAASGGIILVFATISALVRGPRGLALADEVDRRAGLRETLSTAISLEGRGDAWSLAVAESASERARRVVLHDAVPIAPPRGWRVPAVLLAASLLGLWLAPRHDLTGLLARREQDDRHQAEIRATALEITAREQALQEILEHAGVEMTRDETADEATEGRATSPDEMRRNALRKLTQLSDALMEKREGDQSQQLRAMQEQMNKLRTPGPGPMTEFARALARGEFDKARAALEDAARATESGDLSESERREAARQLEALAEQMERLAQNRDALREQLERAGMDPSRAEALASDPSALREALEQMPGISSAQAQQLMNMAMNQAAACESMQSMAGAMSELAKAFERGELSAQEMQAMQSLCEQLGACEMAAAEMRAIDLVLRECNSQMQQYGESMCEGGACMSPGQADSGGGGGVGWGAGTGTGGSSYDPDLPPADDYVLRGERANVLNRGGPIIGSTLVYGAQVRGEAVSQFGEVVDASSVVAAEAIETMQVPREYHDAVRHYFGRLDAIAKRRDPPAARED